MGMILEELGKGNHNQNILYKNPFSVRDRLIDRLDRKKEKEDEL